MNTDRLLSMSISFYRVNRFWNFGINILKIKSVHTRFQQKFDSWSWTWVDVVFFVDLMQCGSISRIWSFDSLSIRWLCLIWKKRNTWCSWSLLNARICLIWRSEARTWCSWCSNVYAWFEEVEHMWCSWSWNNTSKENDRLQELGQSSKEDDQLQGWSTPGVRKSSTIGIIFSRPSGVKKFQSIEMRKTLLFIEFSNGFYEL